MNAFQGHGEGGETGDEDNGEEMSDSSVCSYDDPPHRRFNGAEAETMLQERLAAEIVLQEVSAAEIVLQECLAAEAMLQEHLAAETPQATENTASHRKRHQPQKP